MVRFASINSPVFDFSSQGSSQKDPPIIGTATPTSGSSIDVSYTAPSTPGVVSYTATSSPGGISATLTQSGSGTISVTGLSSGTTYSFTVTANYSSGESVVSESSSNSTTTYGQVEYTTAGSYTWTVPPGVTSISALAIGGGGGGRVLYAYDYYTTDAEKGHLAQGGSGGAGAYMTNYTVTPGQVINIVTGAGGTGGSYTGVNARVVPSSGGNSSIKIGATTLIQANGGKGGGMTKYDGTAPDTNYLNTTDTSYTIGAGVTGVGIPGQHGGVRSGTTLYFGAYGGGGAAWSNLYGGGSIGFGVTNTGSGLPAHNYVGGGGGGVGIYGGSLIAGSYTQVGTSTNPYTGGYQAPGGSGGTAGGAALSTTGSILNITSEGGLYGGGGGSWASRNTTNSNGTKCNGARGAVRIIWPGDVRYYPNTRTADE